MTNTMNATNENVAAINETTIQNSETSLAEICFGSLMAICAIAGIWGAVSLMISYFVG